MKQEKLVLPFLFSLFAFIGGSTGQCLGFDYQIELEGFDCSRFGSICVSYHPTVDSATVACIQNGYTLQLSYASQNFSGNTPGIASNYWQELTGPGDPVDRWQAVLDPIQSGSPITFCLDGSLGILGSTFTIEVVNPTTGDVFSTEDFVIDGPWVNPVGQAGQSTLWSNLIQNVDVLNPTQALTQSQQLHLAGTIIFDVDYRFGVGGTSLRNKLTMEAGTKLIINPNVRVDFISATLNSCDRWAGITVLESVGSRARVLFSDCSVFRADVAVDLENFTQMNCENTVFEDNDIAVRAQGTWDRPVDVDFNFRGGYANGTAFFNNRIGIHLAYAQPVSILRGYLQFDKCGQGISLFGNPTSLDLYGAYIQRCDIGAICQSAAVLRMNFCDFFNNVEAGVSGSLTGLDIQECRIGGTIPATGIFRQPTFAGFEYMEIDQFSEFDNNKDIIGIGFGAMETQITNSFLRGTNGNIAYQYLSKPNRFNYWRIYENQPWQTNLGGFGANVTLRNLNNTEIDDNTDFWAGGNSIRFENGSNSDIADNGLFTENFSGVAMESSVNMSISCNDMIKQGAYPAPAFVVMGTNDGSIYRGNNWRSVPVHDIQYGYPNRQVSVGPQRWHGNEFELSTVNTPEARHIFAENNGPQFADNDRYQVSNLWNRGDAFFPYSGSADWFENSISIDEFTCAEGEVITEEYRREKSIDASIRAIITRENSALPPALTYNSKLNLLRQLEQQPSLDSLQNHYYTILGASELGDLVTLEQQLETQITDFWEDAVEVTQKRVRLHVLDSLLDYYHPVTLDSSMQMVAVDSQSLVEYTKAWDEYSALFAALGDPALKSDFGSLIEQLKTEYLPQGAFENVGTENLVQMYDIMLDRIHPDFIAYSSGQLDQITTLAYGCPDTDGAAVFWARAFFGDHYKTYLEFDDDCEALQGLASTTDDASSSSVKLYPNPTTSTLIIETGKTLDKNGVLVFDNYGRSHPVFISLSENGYLLDVSNLPNGIYWLTGKDFTWKTTFVKQR